MVEWLLMGVMFTAEDTAVPIQQTYSTQAECEAGRKVWDWLTPQNHVWVKSVCVKKVKP